MQDQIIDNLRVKLSEMIADVSRIICQLRKQNYFTALSQARAIPGKFEEVYQILSVQHNYFNSQTEIYNEEGILQILGEIEQAYGHKDYIMLADLYELRLLPFFISLQEFIIQNEYSDPIIILDKKDKRIKYSVEYTSCGEATAAVELGEQRFYLHTNNKVMEEADQIADNWYQGGKKKYLIYGLGLGYHVRALLERSEYIHVSVYESRSTVADLAADYGCLEWLKQQSNFNLILDHDFIKLSEKVTKLQEDTVFEIHGPSLRLIDKERIQIQMEDRFMESNSIKCQEYLLAGNFDRNIRSYNGSVDEITKQFINKDIYIIAAGPSLDRNMYELKKIDKNGIIIATGTILRKLLKAEIRPDYVIITDANKQTICQIDGLENCGIPLIGLSTVYFQILERYKGRKYLVCQKGYEMSEQFAAEKGYQTYETGGSVATTAIDLALKSDCRRIILVGLDLAYTDGMNHAADTDFVSEVGLQGQRTVIGIDGNYVPTGKNLDIYRKWIERRLSQETKTEVIDATEGGAKITGTLVKMLHEVVPQQEGEQVSKPSVLLIKGISQYDAMRNYIDELGNCFTKLGYEAVILDGLKAGFWKDFANEGAKKKYLAVITCNGNLLYEENLKEIGDTIFCTLLFDHPMHHYQRLQNANKNTILLTCDRDNCEYIKRYYPNVGYTDFLPLSGSYHQPFIPYKERKTNLVFTGSNLKSSTALEGIDILEPLFRTIALEIIEELREEPSYTIQQSLSNILNRKGYMVGDKEFRDIMVVTNMTGEYIRAYYREKVVKTIVEAGIPIEIYGNGWEDFECGKRENLILKEGYGKISLQAAANAKISLNVMPWFKAGFQERIATAMLSGTVALTDTSRYIEENFVPDKDIVLYNLKEINKLPDIIKGLLEEPEKAEQIAIAGREKALEKHTWLSRTKELIAILEKQNSLR